MLGHPILPGFVFRGKREKYLLIPGNSRDIFVTVIKSMTFVNFTCLKKRIFFISEMCQENVRKCQAINHSLRDLVQEPVGPRQRVDILRVLVQQGALLRRRRKLEQLFHHIDRQLLVRVHRQNGPRLKSINLENDIFFL